MASGTGLSFIIGNASVSNYKMECANCQNAYASYRCNNCLLTNYCKRDCQIDHWKKHKLVCSNLAWNADRLWDRKREDQFMHNPLYFSYVLAIYNLFCISIDSCPVNGVENKLLVYAPLRGKRNKVFEVMLPLVKSIPKESEAFCFFLIPFIKGKEKIFAIYDDLTEEYFITPLNYAKSKSNYKQNQAATQVITSLFTLDVPGCNGISTEQFKTAGKEFKQDIAEGKSCVIFIKGLHVVAMCPASNL
jgi:hypothetical protein